MYPFLINSPCKIKEAWTRIKRQGSLTCSFYIQFLFKEWCDPSRIIMWLNQCWCSINTKGRKVGAGGGEKLEGFKEETERKEKEKKGGKNRFQGKKEERINS